MCSAWRKWRKPLALGLLLACGAADAATAQFFFQPFFQTWRYEFPPDGDDLPRYGSRRAVARILAGAGYELIGPLRRRGDQIVATGVNRREGQARFFIDPYEGEIIYMTRLDPPAEAQRPYGGDRPDPAEGARRSPRDGGRERATGETGRKAEKRPSAARLSPQAPAENAAPAAPTSTAAPTQPGARESVKPAEIARPPEPAPTQPRAAQSETKPETKPASTPKAEPAAPSAAQKPLAAKPMAARTTGSSHRAIVPPKAADETTTLTPSTTSAATAPAASGAQTPPSVDAPNGSK